MPRSREAAIKKGMDHYLTQSMCERSGHIGVKTLEGECAFCVRERAVKKRNAPRISARAAGQTKYTPDTPCGVCGSSERRVSDNRCEACHKEGAIDRDTRATPASIYARQNPDALLTKEAAKLLGFPLYRTGKTCHRGHTDWRYVSTGNCKGCQG